MNEKTRLYGTKNRACLTLAIGLAVLCVLASSFSLAQSPPGDQIPPPSDNPPPNQPCWQSWATQELPNLGTSFTYTKSFDCDLQAMSSAVVDENGNEVDLRGLLKDEETARQSNPLGKIDPRLLDAIEEDPDKSQRVIAWLTFDEALLGTFAAGLLDPVAPVLGEPPPFNEQQILATETEIQEFNFTQVAATTGQIQQLLGNRVFAVSSTAPVVGIVASGQEILSLAVLPEIDTLYVEETGELLNFDALRAHRVAPDWLNTGLGAGRRIAVLEDEEVEDHIYLNVAGYLSPPASYIDNGHSTLVAGSIASLMFRRLGTAPLVQLFSANSGTLNDLDVVRATDWVVRSRMDVTNISWGGTDPDGTLRFRDRWFDFHSRYNLNSVVAAAGNTRDEFVHSPASAWNVVAVGNIDTGDNPWRWSDDQMYGGSSWKNPLNRNKKPNVAARGTRIKTLGLRRTNYIPDPEIDDQITGTSLSAPFVTATLALAINRNPTLLPSPETAMATVMASAWNKVEYQEIPGESFVRPPQNGIHTSAATRMAGDFRTIYRYISTDRLNERGYFAVPVELRRNDRTRVAVAWSAAARSLVHVLGYLQTDLDVLVFEGEELTGRIVGFSVSDFDNVELVEFTPRITGTHTIAIYAPRLLALEPERVGIAVSLVREDVLGIPFDQ